MLRELRRWQASTVPLAVVLVLAHSVAVTMARSGSTVPDPRPAALPAVAGEAADPVVPSLGDPGLAGAEVSGGGMSPAGDPLPEVRSVRPRPPEAMVGPEQRARVLAQAREEQMHFRASGEGARATHPMLGMDLAYDRSGMRISARRAGLLDEGPSWDVTLRCAGVAFDERPLAAAAGEVEVGGREAGREVAEGCREWWINRDAGIKHGFTLAAPAERPERLAVTLGVETGLRLVAEEDGVSFHDIDGPRRAFYRGLEVYGADGSPLDAEMRLGDDGRSIVIEAGVGEAVFPVTIDPVFGDEVQRSLASDGAPGHEFGHASDGVGEVVAVGAPGHGSGRVYLRHKDEGGVEAWEEVTSVAVPAGESPLAGDRFGESVAVFEFQGKTYLAVGAPNHGGTGAVFVYQRNQGGPDAWGHVQTIRDADLSAGDSFGCAVDGQAGTLVIGAKDQGAGAVYVFETDGGAFVRTQKLTTPNTGTAGVGLAGDLFGAAVAIGGDRVIVGAPGELDSTGGAYLFERGSPLRALFRFFSAHGKPGDFFGLVVAIAVTGLLLAISAPFSNTPFAPREGAGSVHVYALFAAAWIFVTAFFGSEPGAFLGSSLAINAFFDIVVGAKGATVGGLVVGAVFVFLFSELLFRYPDPPDRIGPATGLAAAMAFGCAVVLLGTTLFVLAAGYNGGAGVLYRFILAATLLTYAHWQLLIWPPEFIAANPDLCGRQGDPNGNGLVNEMEYRLGLVPVLATTLLVGGLLAANGDFRFAFRVSLVTVSLLLLIQYSLGLGGWLLFNEGPLAGELILRVLHGGIQAQVLLITLPVALVALLLMRLETREEPL